MCVPQYAWPEVCMAWSMYACIHTYAHTCVHAYMHACNVRRLFAVAYKGKYYKPKNHFATHYAVDARNWGPPRQFWCFGYEAKNQEVKHATSVCNFKDVVGSTSTVLSLQSARSLKRRRSQLPVQEGQRIDVLPDDEVPGTEAYHGALLDEARAFHAAQHAV